jgi:segregation and condensation protein B
MIELKSVIEAILFASQKPLSVAELKALLVTTAEHAEEPEIKAFKKAKAEEITAWLEALREEHEALGRAYRLVCVAESWQFVARPEYAAWLRVLAGERARPSKLSPPALETLTIIAYRQPITRAEIEQIRGVSVDGVMQTLIERDLVEAVGRAEVVGRPITYGTTRTFLEYFGLPNLEDLPGGDELRRIPVERPASLLTVESGLATVPPEQLSLTPTPAVAAEGASAGEADLEPAPKSDPAPSASKAGEAPAENSP